MNHLRASSKCFRSYRVILPALILAACAASAHGQARPPVAVEHVAFKNFPVEMVGVELAGELHNLAEQKPALFGVSFDAPEDWLRHVSFKIRNKTDKTLLSVTLSGSLAVGEAGEIPMGIDLLYGQELDESAFTGRAPRGESRRLAPGETANARWSAAEYTELDRFLSMKRPVASYRRMRLDLREARFEDGTVWSMGKLYRINPLDPRKWTPLDKEETSRAAPPDLKPGERVVEVSSYKPDDDPKTLVISELKVAGQPVTPGRPFFAGEGWLRSLTVRVKNTSAKPILSVQVSFGLPEASYRAGGVGVRLRYGRETATGGRAVPDTKPLLPGEEAELSFTDGEYETQRSFAERRSGVVSFTRVRLGGASVVFVDGTRSFVSNPAHALKEEK